MRVYFYLPLFGTERVLFNINSSGFISLWKPSNSLGFFFMFHTFFFQLPFNTPLRIQVVPTAQSTFQVAMFASAHHLGFSLTNALDRDHSVCTRIVTLFVKWGRQTARQSVCLWFGLNTRTKRWQCLFFKMWCKICSLYLSRLRIGFFFYH